MVRKTWIVICYYWVPWSIDSKHFKIIKKYECIFSLVNFFTNLKKCHFQFDKLKKLIFISKDWPIDPKVDCITLFSLVKLIEMDMELK